MTVDNGRTDEKNKLGNDRLIGDQDVTGFESLERVAKRAGRYKRRWDRDPSEASSIIRKEDAEDDHGQMVEHCPQDANGGLFSTDL